MKIQKENARFETFNANSIVMAHLLKMQCVIILRKICLSRQPCFKVKLVYAGLGGIRQSKLKTHPSFSSSFRLETGSNLD